MSKNAKARVREMAERKYRRIVSLASVAGFMSAIDLAPYYGAKSRIIGQPARWCWNWPIAE